MGRPRNIRDMRQEYEAAVARGLISDEPETSRASRTPSLEPRSRVAPAAPARMKMVWGVRDIGGRTVATYAYTEKAEAEAHAARLKAQGKGNHIVRSEKVPMEK